VSRIRMKYFQTHTSKERQKKATPVLVEIAYLMKTEL